VLLPLLSGLVFWFAMAPDPRFAHAIFLLLPVSASQLLLTRIQVRVRSRAYAVVIAFLFAACNLNLLYWGYQNKGRLKNISLDGWHPIERVPLIANVTRTGLLVYTPGSGGSCWDGPLPCAPYFNENLRLRVCGDLSSGFTVLPLEDYRADAKQGASCDEVPLQKSKELPNE